MDTIKDILIVLIISALVGLGVSGSFALVNNRPLLQTLIAGLLSGSIIGLVSRLCFMFVYFNFRNKPALAFMVVIAIIGTATTLISLYFDIRFPFPAIPLIAASALCGTIVTAIMFHNYNTINARLKQKKEKLDQR